MPASFEPSDSERSRAISPLVFRCIAIAVLGLGSRSVNAQLSTPSAASPTETSPAKAYVAAPVSLPALSSEPSSERPGTVTLAPPLIRAEDELKIWWREQLVAPIGPAENALPMELERAIVQALAQSARVSILRETVAISESLIPQAQATFDPVSFLDTRFTGTSDPVGNTLTTGGSSRFIDSNWYANGGLRKQTSSGAQMELGQRLGYENSNSNFFVPQDQATAKLMLNVTQPLLRGAGQAYNNGVVVLATVDTRVVRSQYFAELQTYLVEFHKAYWDIYQQRAVLLQRRRLLDEARAILRELEARRDVDVQDSQLARVRAAVGNREASLLRYQAAVKDSVSRFKALVNDPFLDNPMIVELIPLDSVGAGYGDADLHSSLVTALEYRPEIGAAVQEISGATQRLDLAKNEVLPMLNVVLGSYVYGLRGNSEFGGAIAGQYDTGRPTYWAGLLYERPLGNRAARAVRDQRIAELQRATSKLRGVTGNVRAEVEIAVREISTTRGEMVSRHQAMVAEEENVKFLLQRWRLLAGEQQVAGVVFNDLLDAQDRRAAAEFEFITSQVAHRVAWVNLRRAMGTLCDCSAINPHAAASPVAAEPIPQPPAVAAPPLALESAQVPKPATLPTTEVIKTISPPSSSVSLPVLPPAVPTDFARKPMGPKIIALPEPERQP